MWFKLKRARPGFNAQYYEKGGRRKPEEGEECMHRVNMQLTDH